MNESDIQSGDGEMRQGNTGVWTFVIKTPEGKIIARSEWGTNYEFDEKQWLELKTCQTPEKEGECPCSFARVL
jgi:hypothetical protein